MSGELKQRFGSAVGGERKETSSAQPAPGETLPLLFNLEAEAWLTERLKDHGVDLYADGPVFTHFRDRLRKVITDNRIESVIIGRREGKPETYAACFERLYEQPLKVKASKQQSKVPRGTNTLQEST
jgi:hypothetical protein